MKRTLIALSLIALSSAAFAMEAPDFTQIDTDANGTLSFNEIQAVYPDLTEEAFAEADADNSGDLTAEEFVTLPDMEMAN